MEPNDDEVIKFKFEGIFKENPISNFLLEKYQEFIQLLESKNSIEFILSEKEIEIIIISMNRQWKIIK